MIYDCFTFFNELDILELRLNELSPVVDYFVLVESPTTHRGDQKPLHFHENRERYKEFLDKIIYVTCDFPTELPAIGRGLDNESWRRENYQRNQIKAGLMKAKSDDLVIVSDVDEIISRQALINALQARPHGTLTAFQLQWFELYIDRIIAPWHVQGPRMIEYRYLSTPQKLRNAKPKVAKNIRSRFIARSHARLWNWINCGIGNSIYEVENAGWHFSSLGGQKKLVEKILAVAPHAPHLEASPNEEEFILKNKVPTQQIGVLDFDNLPEFVKKNPAKFSFTPTS